MPLTLKVAIFMPHPCRTVDRKARSAAAARGRVGVGHLERRAAEILDEIDRRAAHQVEADRIDDQRHAVGLGDRVVVLRSVGQFEPVGEAGAAAAVDRQAQDRAACACRAAIARDALGGAVGQDDVGSLTQSEIGMRGAERQA